MGMFQTPPTYSSASSYEDPRDHKAEDVDAFLRKIAFLESTYGQNTDHRPITSGLNAGTHAVGDYGLMPLTAQDIDRQSGNNQLQDMDKTDVQDQLTDDPALAQRLSSTMASNLLAKNPQDVAAYKWLQGQYTKPDQSALDNSDYVRKFKALQGAR